MLFKYPNNTFAFALLRRHYICDTHGIKCAQISVLMEVETTGGKITCDVVGYCSQIRKLKVPWFVLVILIFEGLRRKIGSYICAFTCAPNHARTCSHLPSSSPPCDSTRVWYTTSTSMRLPAHGKVEFVRAWGFVPRVLHIATNSLHIHHLLTDPCVTLVLDSSKRNCNGGIHVCK